VSFQQKKIIRGVVIAVLVVIGAAAAQDRPASTAPTTLQTVNQLSGHAKFILTVLGKTYGDLNSLSLTGTISGTFDVAGEKKQEQAAFTSSYQSPNLFRHEIDHDIVLAGTGKKIFGYQPRANIYMAADAKEDKPEAADLPPAVVQILRMQDPSLLMALVKNPSDYLLHGAVDIEAGKMTNVDGVPCEILNVQTLSPLRKITMAMDSKSHLLRQVTIDVKDAMEKAGVADVKTALIKIDYTSSKPDAELKREQFAFSPPEGARDMAALHPAGLDVGQAAEALVGKPAPDFSLPALDGKTVTLAELKGSVVILDFWASWCGPCVAGLPQIDGIYRTKMNDGLKAYAVNMREEKSTVQDFVSRTGLSIPVLLNQSDDIGDRYGVEGIPETVVIGKDGVVKKVFVGGGIEEPLKAAIEEAMK
jgi:peroxiredoxin/outer membrane lipoprotein-sorting protein